MKTRVLLRRTAACLVFFVALAASAQSGDVHRFLRITLLPDHSVQLSLTGRVASAFANYFDLYPIEASENLAQWTPLATLLRTNSLPTPLRYLDVEAADLSRRFYRTPTNHFITFILKPTGPFPVGVVSRMLTDPARPDRAPFMVSVWYPAVASAGAWPGLYTDTEIGGDAIYGGANFVPLLRTAHGHALPEVPLATNQAPYPVVIYSHGFGGTRAENTDKMENLASHGYVAVGIDHVDGFASVLPSGQIVYGWWPFSSSAALESRAADVRLVRAELARWQQNDPLFAGQLDLSRVGVCGFSFGGVTAVQLCAVDSSLQAVATLDGGDGAIGLSELADFTTPILIMSGSVVEHPIQATVRAMFRSLFDRATHPNAYWLSLANTTHGDFTHVPWIYTPTDSTKTRAATAMRTYLVAFFNKHLKGGDEPLLEGPLPAFPEVTAFHRSALTITMQPRSQNVRRGANVTFTVSATSPLPITYQWQVGSSNLTGASNASLNLTNVQIADGGRYSVTLADGVTTRTSQEAVLNVGDPPVITQHPQSQTVMAGSNVTFTVSASGTLPLSFRWRKTGMAAITNMTLFQSTCLFTIENVRTNDANTYSVIATNLFGSAPASSNAVLTVLP